MPPGGEPRQAPRQDGGAGAGAHQRPGRGLAPGGDGGGDGPPVGHGGAPLQVGGVPYLDLIHGPLQHAGVVAGRVLGGAAIDGDRALRGLGQRALGAELEAAGHLQVQAQGVARGEEIGGDVEGRIGAHRGVQAGDRAAVVLVQEGGQRHQAVDAGGVGGLEGLREAGEALLDAVTGVGEALAVELPEGLVGALHRQGEIRAVQRLLALRPGGACDEQARCEQRAGEDSGHEPGLHSGAAQKLITPEIARIFTSCRSNPARFRHPPDPWRACAGGWRPRGIP